MSMTDKEVIETFDELKRWHERVVGHFDTIINSEHPMRLGVDEDAPVIEGRDMKMVKLGVTIAKELLGDFPLRLSTPGNEEVSVSEGVGK